MTITNTKPKKKRKTKEKIFIPVKCKQIIIWINKRNKWSYSFYIIRNDISYDIIANKFEYDGHILELFKGNKRTRDKKRPNYRFEIDPSNLIYNDLDKW